MRPRGSFDFPSATSAAASRGAVDSSCLLWCEGVDEWKEKVTGKFHPSNPDRDATIQEALEDMRTWCRGLDRITEQYARAPVIELPSKRLGYRRLGVFQNGFCVVNYLRLQTKQGN